MIVRRIDSTEIDEIVSGYRLGRAKVRISIRELPISSPSPEGAQLIAVYRFQQRGGR